MQTERKIFKCLVSEWRGSGIEPSDIVLIHSSLSKLFKKIIKDFNILPSIDLILDILVETATDKGTILLPLFNFDFPGEKFLILEILNHRWVL